MPTKTKSEKLYDRLTSDYNESDVDYSLAKYLSERMQEVDGIKWAVSFNRQGRDEAQKKFTAAIDILDRGLKGIQSDCPHLSTTYHGDPTGGSDSHTVCDHCKQELPKHWEG